MRALVAAALLAAAVPVSAQDVSARVVAIRSELLGQERELLVRTPPGYDGGTDRYPVLYVTDGRRLLPIVSFLVQNLVAEGRMPDMIVVGVSPIDRTKELTPTRAGLGAAGAGLPRMLPESGGADAFLAFVEQELVPWVDRSYRTTPHRVLAGHSFGGLFTLHALRARPALFRGWIAISPTLTWDDGLPIREVQAALQERPGPAGTLVYTVGDEGPALDEAFGRLERALAAAPHPALRAKGLRLADEDHGSVVLPSAYHGLKEIYAGWRMRVDPGAVGPKGGLAAVERHYRELSARLGWEIAIPENVLNLAGYQLLQEAKLDEAIAAFRRNAVLHPASANVHDSLGEAYERSGRLDLAVASYRKAVELARPDDANLAAFRENLRRAGERHVAPRPEPAAVGR